MVKAANIKHFGTRNIFLLVTLFLSSYSYAQLNNTQQTITAIYTNVSLKEVLKDISKQTGIRFSYSTRKIPEDSKITLSLTNENINAALARIFATLPISYEFVDDYIILKKASGSARPVEDVTPKKFTLSGYIKDNVTSEFLIGATLFINELKTGCITNNYGYFSMTIPEGNYTLEVSYVGFKRVQLSFELKSNLKTDFSLESQPIKLQETIIPALQREDMAQKLLASQLKINPETVEKIPSLMGESDVIKSLSSFSGITFYNEGSSYLHVRGGNYDQNLVILDEATLFNASHLLGIFSPIIPDAVKSIDVYKGDFPVNFGGRLSSVVDIHTRDGNKNKVNVTGNIGLIAARATVEGPFKKDASSYFVSYRKSYFDAYLKPSAPNLKDLYFSDFTSKFNIKLGSKDRLFITLYNGTDKFVNQISPNNNSGINWTNSSFTLRWNHVFGSRTFLNSSFYTSKYDYYLNTSTLNNEYWNSRITNASLKEDFSFFAEPYLTWRYGIKFSFYDFNPGNYYSPKNNGNVQVSPVKSSETMIYWGAEHKISERVKLNYGFQATTWVDYGKAFVIDYDSLYNPVNVTNYADGEQFYWNVSLAPRFSLSVKSGSYSNFKISYNRTNQYINLITNSISPFNSLEVWLPAGRNIKPQYADIIDFGYIRHLGKFNLQSDVYYKWMYNQIGYKYHANMLVNPALEGELRQGKGWSYGWEIALKKENGKFTGEVNYTLSRSFLQIDGLNANRSFAATYDRPHSFNFTGSYQPSERWMFSTDYTITSGARITTPTSFYNYRGYQVPVYTSQNNDRLPVYKRWDVSVTYQLNKPSTTFNHSISFSVLNLGGQQNPIFLYFNKFVDSTGKLLIPMDKLKDYQLTTSIRYTYWIIPSFTYQFKF